MRKKNGAVEIVCMSISVISELDQTENAHC